MKTIRLSYKGQLTQRMLLKPTSLKEVIGCVNYKGEKKSLKAMEEGIAKGARKSK